MYLNYIHYQGFVFDSKGYAIAYFASQIQVGGKPLDLNEAI